MGEKMQHLLDSINKISDSCGSLDGLFGVYGAMENNMEPLMEIEKQITAAMDNFESAIQNILKLNDQVKELKIALSRSQENGRWKPYNKGYCIHKQYKVHLEPASGGLHNCFRTKGLAELRAKQKKAEDELFNIWESLVGDWRPSDGITKFFYGKEKEDMTHWATTSCAPVPSYRLFPSVALARRQYELASDHARAYMRGEF